MTHIKPTLGAIAVVIRDGKTLLVQRKRPPAGGQWGFPGGHVELGETALEAARRELLEETGVRAEPLEYLTNVDVILRGDDGQVARHYLLAVVLCDYQDGEPIAADDAADARWVRFDDVPKLDITDRVEAVLSLARDRLAALRR